MPPPSHGRPRAASDSTTEETLLAALLESLDVGVVACDMAGHVTHLNSRALQVMRADGSEERHPSSWTAQVAPRTPHGRPMRLSELPIVRALRGEVIADVDMLIATADGDVVMNCTARPIRNRDGRQLGAVATFDDVTARRAYEASVNDQLRNARLATQLQAARRDRRLVMYGQPIVDLRTGEIVMEELLLRIRSRRGNVMLPAKMLEAAERQGSVGLIDEWVLEQALAITRGGRPVSVNLSADSLGRGAFRSLAETRIAESRVDPSLITLEITETAVLADIEAASSFAERMKALGCRFSLDDFGTGYGALTYLKKIPFDYVKIDLEFVTDMTRNRRSYMVVESVVAIARCFGQQTIAEGVEDAKTRALLKKLGVDHVQGFLVGPPAPVELRPPRPAGAKSRPALSGVVGSA